MDPPTNMEVREVKADSITLTWRNPTNQQYRFLFVRYKTKQETDWKYVRKAVETVSLSGLELDTEYEIRFTAKDEKDSTVGRDIVTAVTGKTTMNTPTNVEVKEVKADSMEFTWRDPTNQTFHFLFVEYRMKNETDWTSVKKAQERVSLSGLELDTEYEIRFTAIGDQGSTVSRNTVTAVTAKGTMNPPTVKGKYCSVSSDVVTAVTKAISPPTNLEVKDMTKDSITLTWVNPSGQQCQSVLVEYRTEEETEWACKPVKKNQETVTLSGLKPDTEYEIRVTVKGKGCSVSSDVVTAVTAKNTMSPPTNVEVKDVNADSITLTWRNSSDQECRFLIVEYKMKQDSEWTESDPVKKNQETVTLSRLELDTEYEIRVTAVGKEGKYVSSDVVTVVTCKTNMNPPNQLLVKEVKADSITLTWRNPSDQQYQFLFIEYRRKQESEWTSDQVKKYQETVTLSGLELDTEYVIRVTAVGKQGGTVRSDTVTAVTVKPVSSPPTNVKVQEVKANSIILSWSNRKECKYLQQYIVEYKMMTSSVWQKEGTGKEAYTFTLKNLKQNTFYSIRMLTEARFGMSEPSEEIKTKTVKEEPDRKRFTLQSPGNPNLYILKLKTDTGVQLRKKDFGDPSTKCLSNRTIMLVGATGSGKTTLINGMINYVLGVDWEDNWRFKLIEEETYKSQAHSQTSEVTAYQIHHTDEFQIPYSVTIIDTPGFGDTRGIKQDKKITEIIAEFFSYKDGIDSIDAVCFVVQAASARLTPTQRYIFESILSVFGKNIANNIITLVTFADGKTPPVLEAIKEANIPFARHDDDSLVYFKCNNSALFADNRRGIGNEGDFDFMFWKIGKAGMKMFFAHLDRMKTQSLTLTKQVLLERKQLEATVEGVQPLIKKALSTMEEIRTTQAILGRHKTEIEANKDFEYEVEVEKAERLEIPTGQYVNNCHGCNFTCHYPCSRPNDADKRHCSAMRNGYCTVCPGKCVWSVHYCMTYKWDIKRVRERRVYQELKSKYEEAVGEKMSTEQILTQLQVEYDEVKQRVSHMMIAVSESLTRLEEITLRPDPLSTPDYIDLLIESEKTEAKPGYKERIQELEEVRQSAVLMHKVKQGMGLSGVLPVDESIHQKTPTQEYKGVFSKVQKWFKNPNL